MEKSTEARILTKKNSIGQTWVFLIHGNIGCISTIAADLVALNAKIHVGMSTAYQERIKLAWSGSVRCLHGRI